MGPIPHFPRCNTIYFAFIAISTIHLDSDNIYIGRYNIVFFLVTYLMPMLGMMVCYLQMGINLWRADASTDTSNITAHPAMTKSRQNKKRVGRI